jgi:hypothetical protein
MACSALRDGIRAKGYVKGLMEMAARPVKQQAQFCRFAMADMLV